MAGITNLDSLLNGTLPDNSVEYKHVFHQENDYVPTNTDMLMDYGNMPKEVEHEYQNLGVAAKKAMESRREEKPFYDWKTKNKSFLKVYNELYQMGIKNNKFFLRLIDRSLQGIDPYTPLLPVEIQLRMILECMVNPWYWLREVCRIPQDGKPIEPGGGVIYELDRNNLACWYLMLNGIDHYQSKPRQRGKTQNALSEQNYSYHFGTTSATFLFFNKDQALGKTNLYRFKCQRDLLPTWMQMRTVIDDNGKVSKGTENITTMRNPITHNTIKVMPKAMSKDAAIRLGRGETAAFHHFDEMDFIDNGMEIIDASVFSYATASTNARENGGIACRIFTSTPGDANSKTGKAANEWIGKMLRWNDHMFDDKIAELNRLVHYPKRTPIMYVEHTWQELGLPMSWYETQCGLVSFKEDVILREIDLKRIPGNELSPFKKTDIMYLNKHEKKPIAQADYTNARTPFHIFEPLHKEYHYILSCDPADGLDGDNFAITLINPYTLYPAAEFRSPFLSQTQLARTIEKFMDNHCPRSMIVIEANKGRECINRLMETKYRYQVYYDVDKLNSRIIDVKDEYGAERAAAMERRALGLDTTPKSRPKYFGILEDIMSNDRDQLCTPFIKEDVTGLIRKPTTGRIEAGEGFHDDNIMSYLMGLYVYRNASNLEDFGIVRGQMEPPAISAADSPATIKKKLRNIYNYLPDSMKEFFQPVVEAKDPVDEAWNYQRELARSQRDQEWERISADPLASKNSYVPPEYNDAIWDRLDKAIEESNNIDTSVNLDDWL